MARSAAPAMLSANGFGFPPQNFARVVVWEWLNEHGRWRPYGATVCHHIENIIKCNARGSVVLGQADAQLSPYIIDLQSMHQFRQDTGFDRLILFYIGKLCERPCPEHKNSQRFSTFHSSTKNCNS